MALEGRQLGRYRLQRLLGKGAMGEVYLAEDTGINRQVAIKVIRTDVAFEPGIDAVRLFQQEMRIIARLNHPYILPMFDYGDAAVNGTALPYMVMPFGRDGSLAAWLKQRGNPPLLSPGDVAHFVHQAAEALQYAHDQQIIHRDVKPSNFLIRLNQNNPNRPDLLLADFGLARLLSASSNATLSIGGTPPYMAPEQWRGYPVPATDQYMLAVMAYELLAGHPPFRGTLEQLIYQHVQGQPEPPARFNSSIPPALNTVILRALAKQPSDRFPTISTFSHAFDDALQGKEPLSYTSHATFRPPSPLPAPQPDPPSFRQDERSTPGSQSKSHDSYATLDSQHIQAMSNSGPRPVAVPGQPQMANSGRAPAPGQPDMFTTRPDTHSHGGSDDGTRRNPSGRGLNFSFTTRRGANCSIVVLLGLALLLVAGSLKLFTSGTTNTSPPTSSASHTSTTGTTTTSIPGAPPPRATSSPNVNATVTAAATTSQNPYPPFGGTLALNDPLRDNSNGYNWGVDNNMGSCMFSAGAYHVTKLDQPGFFHYCTAEATDFTNFAYQVQMTITKGDQGGLLFRAIAGQGIFYYFHISRKSLYALDLYKGYKFIKTISGGFSPAINTALNQPNLVAVVANAGKLDLYVNLQHLASASDNSLDNGQIGVAADNEGHPTEVVYSNAKVWML